LGRKPLAPEASNDIRYHFAFCARRRYCASGDPICARMEEILAREARRIGCVLAGVSFGKDCVALEVVGRPDIAPADIAEALKWRTETEMRAEFRELRAIPSLWTEGYLVTTGTPDEGMLGRFVAGERKDDSAARVILTAPPG